MGTAQATSPPRRVTEPHQPDEFSRLVRKIVIHERRGLSRERGETLGLSYGAFYNRLNGRAEFNPREISMVLRELVDSRLVDCLLVGTGFRGLRQPDAPAPRSDGDLTGLALSCAIETLNAVRATIGALQGRHMDRQNGIKIETIICDAQRELSSLQLALLDACQ